MITFHFHLHCKLCKVSRSERKRKIELPWQAVEWEGKGQNERRRIEHPSRRNGLRGRYCFLRLLFFRPLEGRKNPDWSVLMNLSIRPADWSTTCYSRAWGFSSNITFNKADKSKDRFELFLQLPDDISHDISFQVKQRSIDRFHCHAIKKTNRKLSGGKS